MMLTKQDRLVLASGNPGKLREFAALLAPLACDVVPQSDFNIEPADETGLSFVENAILKARHASAHSGLPALADDSGIAVDALQGAPGIYSARYAGSNASDTDNLNKLIDAVRDVSEAERQAAYHCVIVYMTHAADPTPVIAQGSWAGRLILEPRGEHGFGYDPVFYVESHDGTAAELDPVIKNRISHRGQALQKLLVQLTD
ncbi:MAG: RdgB/HAM1 family non-canonical purine NTP pyrophosphatase [Gammaproteobacteria bacterium]